MRYETLMDAQLGAFPDSIVLTNRQMYDALRSTTPDWLINHKYEEWDLYRARYEINDWYAGGYYDEWKQAKIEESRARWARNAFYYRSGNPEGFFYACSKRDDGTYRYVGFRYGLEDSEYASGFDDMSYTPTEVK